MIKILKRLSSIFKKDINDFFQVLNIDSNELKYTSNNYNILKHNIKFFTKGSCLYLVYDGEIQNDINGDYLANGGFDNLINHKDKTIVLNNKLEFIELLIDNEGNVIKNLLEDENSKLKILYHDLEKNEFYFVDRDNLEVEILNFDDSREFGISESNFDLTYAFSYFLNGEIFIYKSEKDKKGNYYLKDVTDSYPYACNFVSHL